MIDRSLLAKMLSRMSSTSDAEALTALRKAQDLLAKDGTTWQEVLGVESVRKAGPVPPRPTAPPVRTPQSFKIIHPRQPTNQTEQFVKDMFNDMAYYFARGLRGSPLRRRR